MNTTLYPIVVIIFTSLSTWAALPLTESTFTEIVKEVKVVTTSNQAGTTAKEAEVFKMPDIVRTGRDSRVELTAKDKTITRVGSNTSFTFARSGREIQLQKGSVLFHSPAGAGGGAIKHQGSSAAVLGTTEIAEVLPDGRFKVLVLEGQVTVTLVNGLIVKLKAGQMVIVSTDGLAFGPVTNFNLGELASHLLLVVGFSDPLSSRSLITDAIQEQNQEIAAGRLNIPLNWQEAGLGLDMIWLAFNDSLYYFEGRSEGWNPLDFPGAMGRFVFSTPHFPTVSKNPIIKPPLVTNPNPPIPQQ